MGAISSQITSLTTVYSNFYSDADQRKHQSSASLAFVRGIHRGPENSPHKWPVTRKMFPFDDVIMERNHWYRKGFDAICSSWNKEFNVLVPSVFFVASLRSFCGTCPSAGTWAPRGAEHSWDARAGFQVNFSISAGIILGMGLANERRHCYVMPPLIGQTHTQNDPCSGMIFGMYCSWTYYHCTFLMQVPSIFPIVSLCAT